MSILILRISNLCISKTRLALNNPSDLNFAFTESEI